MRLNQQQSKRALALILAASISHFAVFAAGLKRDVPSLPSTESASADTLFGMLITRGGRNAVVDGAESSSGTSVRTGSQVQTLQDAEATVQLGALGTLDISPNTSLILNFDKTSVNVDVNAGNAVLKTANGVKGFVKTSAVKTETTEVALEPSMRDDQDVDHGDDKGEGVLGNLTNNQSRNFAAVVYSALVATTVIAVIVHNNGRGRNPSPGTPRGPF